MSETGGQGPRANKDPASSQPSHLPATFNAEARLTGKHSEHSESGVRSALVTRLHEGKFALETSRFLLRDRLDWLHEKYSLVLHCALLFIGAALFFLIGMIWQAANPAGAPLASETFWKALSFGPYFLPGVGLFVYSRLLTNDIAHVQDEYVTAGMILARMELALASGNEELVRKAMEGADIDRNGPTDPNRPPKELLRSRWFIRDFADAFASMWREVRRAKAARRKKPGRGDRPAEGEAGRKAAG
jgi:hypothetical protein